MLAPLSISNYQIFAWPGNNALCMAMARIPTFVSISKPELSAGSYSYAPYLILSSGGVDCGVEIPSCPMRYFFGKRSPELGMTHGTIGIAFIPKKGSADGQ